MAKKSSGKLTRMDLISLSIGTIIGSGIITLTGIAIGFTGRSVNIAYIIAGIVTLISSIPQIFIGATAVFRGGQYRQLAVLCGKEMAGIRNYIDMFMVFGGSVYIISIADYLLTLIPGINTTWISIGIVTLVYAINMVGVKSMAKLQNLMVIALSIAIALYIVLGIGNVDFGTYLEPAQFMTGGMSGFLRASVFLTFATGGAVLLVNYSDSAENPTKDIPFAIVVSTLFVVIVYAVMSTVAAGVLPVSEVAFQPLSVSAQSFMSPAVLTFFIIGGAVFAILTTLNFSIAGKNAPLVTACEDGWLPMFLAKTNKHGVPYIYHGIVYAISVVVVLADIDIAILANSTVILTMSTRILMAYAAFALPKKLPELWGKCGLHVKDSTLKALCWLSMIASTFTVVMLIISSSTPEIIGNCAFLALSVIIAFAMRNKTTIDTTTIA